MFRARSSGYASSLSIAVLRIPMRCASTDPAEVGREQQLREQIRAKYQGMRLPEMTNFTYGKFAGRGPTTGSTNQQSGNGAQDAFRRWTGGGSSGNGNNTSGGGQQAVPSVDWLMLLTGTALVLVTSRMLSDRLNGPTNNENHVLPLWCVPFDQQAKYLLFLVSVDTFVRDQLHQEYQQVRLTYPLLCFFDWLDQRYPAYGSGWRYNKALATDIIANVLMNGGQMQLAALATSVSNHIGRPGGSDPQGKVDMFVEEVERASGYSGRHRGGGPAASYGGHVSPAPFGSPFGVYAPPQHTSAPAYFPPPAGIAQPPAYGYPQPGMGTSPPVPTPLSHGVQEISLDDVLSSVQGSRINSDLHAGMGSPSGAHSSSPSGQHPSGSSSGGSHM